MVTKNNTTTKTKAAPKTVAKKKEVVKRRFRRCHQRKNKRNWIIDFRHPNY
jgi:hypothetical protein